MGKKRKKKNKRKNTEKSIPKPVSKSMQKRLNVQNDKGQVAGISMSNPQEIHDSFLTYVFKNPEIRIYLGDIAEEKGLNGPGAFCIDSELISTCQPDEVHEHLVWKTDAQFLEEYGEIYTCKRTRCQELLKLHYFSEKSFVVVYMAKCYIPEQCRKEYGNTEFKIFPSTSYFAFYEPGKIYLPSHHGPDNPVLQPGRSEETSETALAYEKGISAFSKTMDVSVELFNRCGNPDCHIFAMKSDLQKSFKKMGKELKKEDKIVKMIHCKQPKLLNCKGCESIRYCSKKCQGKMWNSHKVECKRIQKQRTAFDLGDQLD